MGTDGRWNGANSPIDPWQHGNEGGAERGDRRTSVAGLTPGSAHCTGKPAWLERSRGATLRADYKVNRLTHVLPRCLPTPNSVEADEGG